jgi:pantoate--beta-alanine ligase
MYQATSVTELRQYVQHWNDHSQSIAFIPTMGNLHAGHMSLIEKGQSLCDRTICSIFVNPMQFGPNEDWDHYPRSLDADIAQLEAIGCDLVYLPTASELYPEGLERISQVQVTDLTEHYEGAHRPGHFAGVATVVLKLFNIVRPDVSVFGKKDFQQYRVISKMVEDFNLDVQIIGQETTRDASGLAISSRNQYLDNAQKRQAATIYQLLRQSAQQIDQGERDFEQLQQKALATLDKAGFRTDYFCICNSETLLPATTEDRDLVILVAAALGSTRLLDNIEIALW